MKAWPIFETRKNLRVAGVAGYCLMKLFGITLPIEDCSLSLLTSQHVLMCDYENASRALTYSLIVGGIVSNGKGAPHMLLLTVNNMREVNVMHAVGNDIAKNSHAAAPLAQSAIQRFDVAVGNYKYGELKVDMETAKFVANANAGKRLADEQVTLAAVKNETILHRIAIAHSTVKNSGWVHFEGTLTAAQIDWIHANGDNAWFGLVLQRIYPPFLQPP